LADVTEGRDILKNFGYLLEKAHRRYRFIEDKRSAFGVERKCRILRISMSSYYDWLDREPSEHQLRRQMILPQIMRGFRNSPRTYGNPKVFYSLKARVE
jgi:hypothetical protein